MLINLLLPTVEIVPEPKADYQGGADPEVEFKALENADRLFFFSLAADQLVVFVKSRRALEFTDCVI